MSTIISVTISCTVGTTSMMIRTVVRIIFSFITNMDSDITDLNTNSVGGGAAAAAAPAPAAVRIVSYRSCSGSYPDRRSYC